MEPGSATRNSEGSRGKRNWPLPREHGAWALLFGPLLIGFLASRQFGWAGLLFVLGAVSLFLAREPVARLVRGSRHGVRPDLRNRWLRWAVSCSGLGIVCISAVVFGFGKGALLWIGGIALPMLLTHLWLTERREDRSILAELLGIAALTLGAPAAWHVGSGLPVADGWLLWLLSFAYFASAVFFVKMEVSRFLKPQRFPAARRLMVLYHGLAAAGLVVASAVWPASPWLLFAYVPMFLRSGWGALRGPARLNLKRLGYLEVLYSTWFVLVLGVLFGR